MRRLTPAWPLALLLCLCASPGRSAEIDPGAATAALWLRAETVEGRWAAATTKDRFGGAALALKEGVDSAAVALARLRLDQVGILRALALPPDLRIIEAASALLDDAETRIAEAEAGRDALAGRSGTLETAYLSPLDGSAQPYRLFVPPAKEGGGARPVVVLLHGYVPSYNKLRWMQIPRELEEIFTRLDCILLLPFGRGNTDFQSIGERDVLDALADASRRWPIDPARRYLAGYSMGGSGVWSLLAHRPGIFAAAQVWSGRNDYFLWHEAEYARAGVTRETIPVWKRWLIEADNAADLPENLLHTPLRVVHPDDDALVQPEQSRKMFERLKPPAGRMELIVPPTGEGHWAYADELATEAPWRFLLQHRLEQPAQRDLVCFTPEYGATPEAAIVRLETWGRRARLGLDATQKTLGETGRENVAAAQVGQIQAEIAPEGLHKVAGLCGPVKEAFNRPFLLVLGTTGTPAQQEANIRLRNLFASDWLAFAHGTAPERIDRELRPEDAAGRNLVLIGSPESNAVLAKIAGRLPFRFLGDGYGVGDHEARGEGLGFAGVFPNPDSPGRLVVVLDGRYYPERLSFNHKWDLCPDFICFGEASDPEDGTPTARFAGLFDARWRFDPALSTRGPAAAPR